jgi:hypothetical protein
VLWACAFEIIKGLVVVASEKHRTLLRQKIDERYLQAIKVLKFIDHYLIVAGDFVTVNFEVSDYGEDDVRVPVIVAIVLLTLPVKLDSFILVIPFMK